MDDIIKLIAAKHAGSMLNAVAPKPEPPVREVREYQTATPYVQRKDSYLGNERLYPTTRVIAGIRREKSIPTRSPVDFAEFAPGELEELLLIPVDRKWYFEDWLHFLGLPKDLDHRHDPIFGMALDAYMARKRESHKR